MPQFNPQYAVQGLKNSGPAKRSPFENWQVPELNLKVPNSRLVPEDQLRPNPIDGGFAANESSFDPRAIIDQVDMGLSSEYGNRFRQEQGLQERGYDAAPLAMKGLQADAEARLAKSPLTAQRAEYDQFNKDASSAYQEGYRGDSLEGTPGSSQLHAVQERNLYKKSQEARKQDMPLLTAQENSRGDLEQQREVSRGNLASTTENTRGVIRQAEIGAQRDLNKAQAFNELRGALGAGDSMSVSGIGSARKGAERPMAAALFTPVNNARQALEDAKGKSGGFMNRLSGGRLGGNEQEITQRQAELDAAIQGFLVNHPAADEIKSWASEAAQSPDYQNQSLDEILDQNPQDELSEQEYQQLKEIWRVYGRK